MKFPFFFSAPGELRLQCPLWFRLLARLLAALNGMMMLGTGLVSAEPYSGSFLSAGELHSLLVDVNGQVWAWGTNSVGESGPGYATNNLVGAPVKLPSLNGVVAASAGGFYYGAGYYGFSLVLKNDGTVWGFGQNGSGQLGTGNYTTTGWPAVQATGVTNAIGISAGGFHSLLLGSDGSVWAAGSNSHGQLGDGTTTSRNSPTRVQASAGVNLTNVVGVAAGNEFSLALMNDGTVKAWGYNGASQLGDGTSTDRSYPVSVSGLTNVVQIAAGAWHSMALTADGRVFIWGNGGDGESGNNTFTNMLVATRAGSLVNVVAIAAGRQHCVVLGSDGTVWTWGSNASGQLSTRTGSWGVVGSVAGISNAVAIKAGNNHTLVADSQGYLWGFGGNESGEIAGAAAIDSSAHSNPGTIGGVGPWSLRLRNHVAMTLANGTPTVWGAGQYGQLGLGNTASRSTPGYLSSLTGLQSVAAGNSACIGLLPGGGAYLWGANDYGQQMDGTFTNSNVPSVRFLNPAAVSAAVGAGHSLLALTNGAVLAWGRNTGGQVGDGTLLDRTNAISLSGITTGIAVSAGEQHSATVLADGSVRTWGVNTSGQLGDGSVIARTSPVQVTGLGTNLVKQVVSGNAHSVVLVNGGKVWSWGYNAFGQLGDGTLTQRTAAVNVGSLTGIVAIASGAYTSYAVRNDGTIWAWGRGLFGELGNGVWTNSPTPVQVAGVAGATNVFAGENFALACLADGSVKAWGNNAFGQLGFGTTASSATAAAVPNFSMAQPPAPQASVGPTLTRGRMVRGLPDQPSATAFVMPLTQQQGVELDAVGSAFYQPGGGTPWLAQVQREVRQEITLSAPPPSTLTRISVQNPIAAFGASSGASILFPGMTYTFGVYAGGLDEVTSDTNAPNVIRILAYARSSFTPTATNLTPTSTILVTLPRRTVAGDVTAWNAFITNDFNQTVVATNVGLTTTVEFVGGTAPVLPWGLDWYTSGLPSTGFTLAGYKVSHFAADAATNYYFLVEVLGSVQASDTTLARFCTTSGGAWAYAPMYTMDFTSRPRSNVLFADQPHFDIHPLPPFYDGLSPDQLEAQAMAQTAFSPVWIYTNSIYSAVNNSPELYAHPELDKLVTSLRKDPVAIANFVQNEIGLVDAISTSGTNTVDTTMVTPGGVVRGALGAYLERQGSPVEQCALLIYLLRQAGYSAAYAWPTNNNVQMLDSRLSRMLKMQLDGVQTDQGGQFLPSGLITVNFPWVVLNLSSNRCVHLFPWIKDTKITQGLNVWDYLPSGYNSAAQWVGKYVRGDTNLLNLDLENNLPLYLLPKFITAQIATNAPGLSLDDFGVKVTNRRHNYARWEDFPTPNLLTNQSQYVVLDTLSNANSPVGSGIFDTVYISINPKVDGMPYIEGIGQAYMPFMQLWSLRAVDFFNRRLTIRTGYETSGMYAGYPNASVYLAPFYTGITNTQGAFFEDNLLGSQLTNRVAYPPYWQWGFPGVTLSSPFGWWVGITVHHHNWVGTNHWAGFLGAGEFLAAGNTLSISPGEIVSVVFNAGNVTPQMLKVHADEFVRIEQARAATNSFTPQWYDYQGAAAYLMGMGYYENCSRFLRLDEQLTGARMYSHFDFGLARLTPRTVGGVAMVQGNVDMYHSLSASVMGNTFRPDLGESRFSSMDDWLWLWSAHYSAAEHYAIDSTLLGGAAISTVRLLQLTQQRASQTNNISGIIELNSKNYLTLGAQTNAGWATVAMKDIDTNLWAATTNWFNTAEHFNVEHTRILVTPGKVTNEVSSYIGMGALIVGKEGGAALIGGNTIANGGAGSFISPFDVSGSASFLPYSIAESRLGSYSFVNNSLDVGAGRSVFNAFDAAALKTTSYNYFQPDVVSFAQYASYLTAADPYSSQPVFNSYDRGFFGKSGFVDTVFEFVADPVNTVSGEFYIDQVDLSLPGPFPLELRRNYLSQNQADGPFGVGWKMNLMPYLFATTNTNSITLMLAASPDGSVVAFRKLTNGTFTVDIRDNPLLSNDHRDGMGGLNNWFNATLVQFTTNSVPAYLLTEPNGAVRTYIQHSDFAVGSGSSVLNRVRPYLTSWQDSKGNSLSFIFGTNNAATDFGEVSRIESCNGDALVFLYDAYGRVTEAYTRDGRRVAYAYDQYGDLTKVTQPDASEINYRYQHAILGRSLAGDFNATNNPTSATNWLYQWLSPDNDYLLTSGAFSSCHTGAYWSASLPAGVPFWGGSTDTNSQLGPGIFRPGNSKACQTTFYTPRAGKISITGDVTGPTNSGSAAVMVRIYSAGFAVTSLVPGYINNGWLVVTPGSTQKINLTGLSVGANQYMAFQVASTGTGTNTAGCVYWNPTITYTDASTNYSTHLLSSEIKPDGRTLQNVYDTQRRVTTQLATVGTDMQLYTNATFVYNQTVDSTTSGSPTLTGNTVVTDIRGNSITYGYGASLITNITDALGSTRQEWYPDTATAPGYPRSLLRTIDKRGLVHQFLYDAEGNATNTLVYITNSVPGLKADLTGDGVTLATLSAIYNANGLPVSMTDASGILVSNIYSGTYPFLVSKSLRYAVDGTPISTNTYTYYNTNTISSDGINSFTNQAYGLLQTVVHAGATNSWRHDGRGYVTQEIGFPTSENFSSSDPVITNSFTYNWRGNMIESVRPNGRRTLYDYDDMSRPEVRQVVDETGAVLSTEATYYNDNGEVEWIDGVRSQPEDYVYRDYDGGGRLALEMVWRSRGMTNGLGVEEETGANLYATSLHYYDGFGNETNRTDALGHFAAMQYDALGRMTNQVSYDVTSGTAVAVATQSFLYEPGGQVSLSVNPLGGQTTNIYNVMGLLVERRNPDGSTNRWSYYTDSRPKSETLVNGSYWLTTYNDATGTTTRRFYDSGSNLLATVTAVKDARGNEVQSTDAAGFTTTSRYDGLNRPKSIQGPVFNSSGAYRSLTFAYDDSESLVTQTNAKGEKEVTARDALGRVTSSAVIDGAGKTNRYGRQLYSTDHNQVVTVAGTGSTAITNAVFTDTLDQPVIRQSFPVPGVVNYALRGYNALEEPVFDRDELGQVTTYAYDGLARRTSLTYPDGKTVSYGYDGAGNKTSQTMPGGSMWSASYDVASRRMAEQLKAGTTTNRQFTFQYFTNAPPVGLPSGLVNVGRGLTNRMVYDAWLRVTTNAWTEAIATNALTLSYAYDVRGLLTNVNQVLGTGTSNAVARTYDAEADLATETVSLNGAAFSSFTQSWDGAGRRTALAAANLPMAWSFSQQADGQLTRVTANGRNYDFAYDLNGALSSRSNPWRQAQVQRDGRGRVLALNQAVGPVRVSAESLAWRDNSTLSTYTATRSGTGAWNELRGLAYNSRGQLTGEGLGNAQAAHSYDANGLGVHTGVTLSGALANTWSTSLDAFSRPSTESGVQSGAMVHGSGVALGASSVSVMLNSVSQSGVLFDPRAGDGRWALDFNAPTGTSTLVATATHPISGAATNSTSTFTVVGSESIGNTYDGAGNVSARTLTGSRTQTLKWDALGRLVNVQQVDTSGNGYSFASVFDGLGRRLRTIYSVLTNSVAVASSVVTTDSYYDPEVEFLELGVAVNGQRTWKVYGPDLTGGYGAQQGIGGLEATIRESDGFTTGLISDAFGHTLATTSAANRVTWTGMRFGGYGPVEGYQVPWLSPAVSLAEATLWRGKRIDPTEYYWFGANIYDPLSGRWLSPDSVGHEGNLSLYTYCNGDPVNGIDPDGRLGKGAWEGLNDQIDRMTGIRSDWDVNLHAMQGSTAFRIGYQVGESAPDIAMNVAMLVLPEVLPALAGAGTVSRVGRTFSLAVKEIEAVEVGAQTVLNLERAAVSPLEAALQGEASLLPKIESMAASTTTREQGLVFNPKAHYNFETFNEGITGAPPSGGGGAAKALPELEISASKYPELAENILNAQKAGHSGILTHGGDINANRAAALEGVPNIKPFSRDEYPFASSIEGGAGSWVGHVPVKQQYAQGGLITDFLRKNNIQPGSQYRVVVKP